MLDSLKKKKLKYRYDWLVICFFWSKILFWQDRAFIAFHLHTSSQSHQVTWQAGWFTSILRNGYCPMQISATCEVMKWLNVLHQPLWLEWGSICTRWSTSLLTSPHSCQGKFIMGYIPKISFSNKPFLSVLSTIFCISTWLQVQKITSLSFTWENTWAILPLFCPKPLTVSHCCHTFQSSGAWCCILSSMLYGTHEHSCLSPSEQRLLMVKDSMACLSGSLIYSFINWLRELSVSQVPSESPRVTLNFWSCCLHLLGEVPPYAF